MLGDILVISVCQPLVISPAIKAPRELFEQSDWLINDEFSRKVRSFILRAELTPLLEMIRTDWLKCKTDGERCIMMRHARVARVLTICGYFSILVLIIFSVILPTCGLPMRYVTNQTDPNKLLPLQSYYMYNIYNSPVYEMIFVLQGFCVMSAGVMFTSTDSFMGLLIFHMCGQLENLRERILHVERSDFVGALSRNVRDHGRLIRLRASYRI